MIDSSAHINGCLSEAADVIGERGGENPHVAIVAGSGLDYLSELVFPEVEIAYDDIPGFPLTHVYGHTGSLLLGRWNRLNVALLRGRGHYYEGYSMTEIARPVQALACLGARTLLVTSAVGGVTSEFVPGTLALISDHINLSPTNPLIGANDDGTMVRYLNLLRAYSPDLRSKLQDRLNRETGKTLPEGVLAFLNGPCFETQAELNWLRIIGADLVGWSLVPEVIAAVHAGMAVLAFGLVTDYSHASNEEGIDIDKIFEIGPSHKVEHLPVFEAALTTIESSVMPTTSI